MEIKKALTFRASSIGDCLMGKYLLENIHTQFPQARCGLVVASHAKMIRDLFVAYPWLEVVEANRWSPTALFSLYKNFYGSDLVVTQYAGKPGGRFSQLSKLFARMLAKREGLIGFKDASPWNRILCDQLVPVHPDEAVAERDRAALRAAGVPIAFPFPTLRYVEDHNVLHRFGLEAGSYMVVHLFAGNAARGLHPDKRHELIAALAKKLPGIRVVISGGMGDREEALRAAKDTPTTIVAGETTLQEMMNLIAGSRAVVSVDTGMAHIAAQLHKPLMVMRTCVGRTWWLPAHYGKNAPITVFDYDAACRDGHSAQAYPVCMNAIDMEDVAGKASML